MKFEDIEKICVVGAGTMGRQIALANAVGGYKVSLNDSDEKAIDNAKKWTYEYLDGRIAKGRMSQDQVNKIKENLMFTSSLEEATNGASLVIEAIIELLEAKRELFSKLDKVCNSETILATNSSSFVSSLLADCTERSSKVINMHFFNPAMVMELVEVVKGPHTSDETANLVIAVAKKINKSPILLKKEIDGFVVNRFIRVIVAEASYLLENDVASFEDIDIGVEKGLRHPMGPFKLMDQIGIDVMYSTRAERYKKTGKEEDKPEKILEEKFKKNELGRKTGKGFYTYSPKA
mgnify:CR=1 FL=1|jgi:3-hydroxybutyryl-CoA dehydrogenase